MIVKQPMFFQVEVRAKVNENRLGAVLDTELTKLVEDIFFKEGGNTFNAKNSLRLTAAKVALSLNLPSNSVTIVPKSKLEVLRTLTMQSGPIE